MKVSILAARINKQEYSMISLNNLPIIIDVEASGFGPFSYPIEIGVAMNDGEKYCTLILPSPKWTHWDEAAEQIHHISRDTLYIYGKPMVQVAMELNLLLQGKTVYTDGWVVDKPWILKLFDDCGLVPEFYTSSLELILTEEQMAKWHDTKDAILDELKLQRHRASYDAYVIQQTWMRTRTRKAN